MMGLSIRVRPCSNAFVSAFLILNIYQNVYLSVSIETRGSLVHIIQHGVEKLILSAVQQIATRVVDNANCCGHLFNSHHATSKQRIWFGMNQIVLVCASLVASSIPESIVSCTSIRISCVTYIIPSPDPRF
jgi:hypothetical protein